MLKTNVVESDQFHATQSKTLNMLKDALINSFGPMGSNTMIIKENKYNRYTKDGYSILQEIQCANVIEMFTVKDIVEITRNIVTTVGDGTTSAIILSALIFDACYSRSGLKKYPPVMVANMIKRVANEMSEIILSKKKETTPEDIYNIALISTNGNEDIANRLKVIYEKYGNDVFIDVAASTTKETLIKEYDGMTLETGFADPCFVNNTKGTCYLRKPRIYAFYDPIDTIEMQSFLLEILDKNIVTPGRDPKASYVPTVIMAPRIGSDVNAILEQFMNQLTKTEVPVRPPVLIITNILDIDRYTDIVKLSGARFIRKYLDPKMQAEDIKNDLAPTLSNITTWAAGSADVVEADTVSTKFINPQLFFDLDDDGNRIYSAEYNSYITWLEQKLDESMRDQANANVTGTLKRRINALKANMVEYLVGGISPTDRDAERDLVEDAVLNCRSAAKNGYGRAANIEGAIAALELFRESVKAEPEEGKDEISDEQSLYINICDIIQCAYEELLEALVASAGFDKDANEEEITNITETIIYDGIPYNVKTKEYDEKVISSIQSDVMIIQSIAKILSIMITANQCIVPNPMLNLYSTK